MTQDYFVIAQNCPLQYYKQKFATLYAVLNAALHVVLNAALHAALNTALHVVL